MYHTYADSSNSNSKYNTYHNGFNTSLKMRHRNGYTGGYCECGDDQLVRSRNRR